MLLLDWGVLLRSRLATRFSAASLSGVSPTSWATPLSSAFNSHDMAAAVGSPLRSEGGGFNLGFCRKRGALRQYGFHFKTPSVIRRREIILLLFRSSQVLE